MTTTFAPQVPEDDGRPVTVAFDDSDGFEIALRRRIDPDAPGGQVDELVVNGMFAMDSVEVASELALARLVPQGAGRVLVGGLGLGFTAGTVLDDHPDAQVDVVELSSALISWARKGFTAGLAHVAGNPRARLVHTDVKDVLTGSGGEDLHGPWDAILLDVDNGPSFLIHDHNESLYGDDLLTSSFGMLADGGLLAIWCEQDSPELDRRLRRLDPGAEVLTVPITREGHQIDYAIHVARRR